MLSMWKLEVRFYNVPPGTLFTSIVEGGKGIWIDNSVYVNQSVNMYHLCDISNCCSQISETPSATCVWLLDLQNWQLTDHTKQPSSCHCWCIVVGDPPKRSRFEVETASPTKNPPGIQIIIRDPFQTGRSIQNKDVSFSNPTVVPIHFCTLGA